MNEQQFRELLHASVEELKEARAENERLRKEIEELRESATVFALKNMAEELVELRAENARLKEELHYCKGTCDLAMKHRDVAEAEIVKAADAAELGRLRQDNLRLIETVERQQAELKTLHDALCMDTILDDDHNQG
jgi:predicted nuclease with TOPRIM domain